MIQLVSTSYAEKCCCLTCSVQLLVWNYFFHFYFHRRRAVLHSTYRGKNCDESNFCKTILWRVICKSNIICVCDPSITLYNLCSYKSIIYFQEIIDNIKCYILKTFLHRRSTPSKTVKSNDPVKREGPKVSILENLISYIFNRLL